MKTLASGRLTYTSAAILASTLASAAAWVLRDNDMLTNLLLVGIVVQVACLLLLSWVARQLARFPSRSRTPEPPRLRLHEDSKHGGPRCLTH